MQEFENKERNWVVYRISTNEDQNTTYIGITQKVNILERVFYHFIESVTRTTSNNHNKHDWFYKHWRTINVEILKNNILLEKEARLIESEYVFYYRSNKFNVLNDTYIAINCYTKDNKFYKTYPSYAHASNDLEISINNISSSVNTDSWVYNSYKFKRFIFTEKLILELDDKETLHKNCPVLQYTLDGEFIKEWNDKRELRNFLNIDESQLSKYVRNNKPLRGFLYANKENPLSIKALDKAHKVKMYKNNEFIKGFISNRECARYIIENKFSKSTVDSLSGGISKSIKNKIDYLGFSFTK